MRVPPDIDQLISGLPGEEIILSGLRDLESGEFGSQNALLILIARSRLTSAGLTFLDSVDKDEQRCQTVSNESMLYKRLQKSDPESAFGQYKSMKRLLDSFVRCLELRQARLAGV